jgi:2-keto-3-deoxy-galactonokinase
MSRLAKRRRSSARRHEENLEAAQLRAQAQVVMARMRQACYGLCGAAFVAIPAALMSEHAPPLDLLGSLARAALLTGATGLMIEVLEIRVFPGGKNGS